MICDWRPRDGLFVGHSCFPEKVNTEDQVARSFSRFFCVCLPLSVEAESALVLLQEAVLHAKGEVASSVENVLDWLDHRLESVRLRSNALLSDFEDSSDVSLLDLWPVLVTHAPEQKSKLHHADFVLRFHTVLEAGQKVLEDIVFLVKTLLQIIRAGGDLKH